MYSKPVSFRIAFTDNEFSVIGPALEDYIKRMTKRDFFMDIYTDGDVLPVIMILRQMKNRDVVTLDITEIRTIVGILKEASKKNDTLLQLITDLTCMI